MTASPVGPLAAELADLVFEVGATAAGSSGCSNAGKFLLAHKGIELVHVRLRVGKAYSMPREHEISQDVIGVPLSGIGVEEKNRHHRTGVMKINHARRKRREVGIFYD